jgi:molybdopterin-guanine dinucleotide biosynthesis protein A
MPPSPTPAPIGIVLAGGQSTRMGTDKAALCIQNESLLLRARRLLLESGCTQVILSGPARPNWPDPVMADTLPMAGPVGGMVSCLNALQASLQPDDPLILVAVDTPLLSPELIVRLLDASRSHHGAMVADHPLPLVLRQTSALMTRVQSVKLDQTHGKAPSIRDFLRPLDIACLAVSDHTQTHLLNINTPADWKRFQDECAP